MTSQVDRTTDIHIVNTATIAGIWDDWLQLPNGGLDEKQVIGNIVKVALLTDRRSDEDEILPDPDSSDRRGWWGDFDAQSIWDGWQIGCKNWLLLRAKILPADAQEGSTLVRAEHYTREALQPMIDKRICTSIDVEVERVGLTRIDVIVRVYRGPRQEIALRFQELWTDIKKG
jgi:phage gp46-like protein